MKKIIHIYSLIIITIILPLFSYAQNSNRDGEARELPLWVTISVPKLTNGLLKEVTGIDYEPEFSLETVNPSEVQKLGSSGVTRLRLVVDNGDGETREFTIPNVAGEYVQAGVTDKYGSSYDVKVKADFGESSSWSVPGLKSSEAYYTASVSLVDIEYKSLGSEFRKLENGKEVGNDHVVHVSNNIYTENETGKQFQLRATGEELEVPADYIRKFENEWKGPADAQGEQKTYRKEDFENVQRLYVDTNEPLGGSRFDRDIEIYVDGKPFVLDSNQKIAISLAKTTSNIEAIGRSAADLIGLSGASNLADHKQLVTGTVDGVPYVVEITTSFAGGRLPHNETGRYNQLYYYALDRSKIRNLYVMYIDNVSVGKDRIDEENDKRKKVLEERPPIYVSTAEIIAEDQDVYNLGLVNGDAVAIYGIPTELRDGQMLSGYSNSEGALGAQQLIVTSASSGGSIDVDNLAKLGEQGKVLVQMNNSTYDAEVSVDRVNVPFKDILGKDAGIVDGYLVKLNKLTQNEKAQEDREAKQVLLTEEEARLNDILLNGYLVYIDTAGLEKVFEVSQEEALRYRLKLNLAEAKATGITSEEVANFEVEGGSYKLVGALNQGDENKTLAYLEGAKLPSNLNVLNGVIIAGYADLDNLVQQGLEVRDVYGNRYKVDFDSSVGQASLNYNGAFKKGVSASGKEYLELPNRANVKVLKLRDATIESFDPGMAQTLKELKFTEEESKKLGEWANNSAVYYLEKGVVSFEHEKGVVTEGVEAELETVGGSSIDLNLVKRDDIVLQPTYEGKNYVLSGFVDESGMVRQGGVTLKIDGELAQGGQALVEFEKNGVAQMRFNHGGTDYIASIKTAYEEQYTPGFFNFISSPTRERYFVKIDKIETVEAYEKEQQRLKEEREREEANKIANDWINNIGGLAYVNGAPLTVGQGEKAVSFRIVTEYTEGEVSPEGLAKAIETGLVSDIRDNIPFTDFVGKDLTTLQTAQLKLEKDGNVLSEFSSNKLKQNQQVVIESLDIDNTFLDVVMDYKYVEGAPGSFVVELNVVANEEKNNAEAKRIKDLEDTNDFFEGKVAIYIDNSANISRESDPKADYRLFNLAGVGNLRGELRDRIGEATFAGYYDLTTGRMNDGALALQLIPETGARAHQILNQKNLAAEDGSITETLVLRNLPYDVTISFDSVPGVTKLDRATRKNLVRAPVSHIIKLESVVVNDDQREKRKDKEFLSTNIPIYFGDKNIDNFTISIDGNTLPIRKNGMEADKDGEAWKGYATMDGKIVSGDIVVKKKSDVSGAADFSVNLGKDLLKKTDYNIDVEGEPYILKIDIAKPTEGERWYKLNKAELVFDQAKADAMRKEAMNAWYSDYAVMYVDTDKFFPRGKTAESGPLFTLKVTDGITEPKFDEPRSEATKQWAGFAINGDAVFSGYVNKKSASLEKGSLDLYVDGVVLSKGKNLPLNFKGPIIVEKDGLSYEVTVVVEYFPDTFIDFTHSWTSIISYFDGNPAKYKVSITGVEDVTGRLKEEQLQKEAAARKQQADQWLKENIPVYVGNSSTSIADNKIELIYEGPKPEQYAGVRSDIDGAKLVNYANRATKVINGDGVLSLKINDQKIEDQFNTLQKGSIYETKRNFGDDNMPYVIKLNIEETVEGAGLFRKGKITRYKAVLDVQIDDAELQRRAEEKKQAEDEERRKLETAAKYKTDIEFLKGNIPVYINAGEIAVGEGAEQIAFNLVKLGDLPARNAELSDELEGGKFSGYADAKGALKQGMIGISQGAEVRSLTDRINLDKSIKFEINDIPYIASLETISTGVKALNGNDVIRVYSVKVAEITRDEVLIAKREQERKEREENERLRLEEEKRREAEAREKAKQKLENTALENDLNELFKNIPVYISSDVVRANNGKDFGLELLGNDLARNTRIAETIENSNFGGYSNNKGALNKGRLITLIADEGSRTMQGLGNKFDLSGPVEFGVEIDNIPYIVTVKAESKGVEIEGQDIEVTGYFVSIDRVEVNQDLLDERELQRLLDEEIKKEEERQRLEEEKRREEEAREKAKQEAEDKALEKDLSELFKNVPVYISSDVIKANNGKDFILDLLGNEAPRNARIKETEKSSKFGGYANNTGALNQGRLITLIPAEGSRTMQGLGSKFDLSGPVEFGVEIDNIPYIVTVKAESNGVEIEGQDIEVTGYFVSIDKVEVNQDLLDERERQRMKEEQRLRDEQKQRDEEERIRKEEEAKFTKELDELNKLRTRVPIYVNITPRNLQGKDFRLFVKTDSRNDKSEVLKDAADNFEFAGYANIGGQIEDSGYLGVLIDSVLKELDNTLDGDISKKLPVADDNDTPYLMTVSYSRIADKNYLQISKPISDDQVPLLYFLEIIDIEIDNLELEKRQQIKEQEEQRAIEEKEAREKAEQEAREREEVERSEREAREQDAAFLSQNPPIYIDDSSFSREGMDFSITLEGNNEPPKGTIPASVGQYKFYGYAVEATQNLYEGSIKIMIDGVAVKAVTKVYKNSITVEVQHNGKSYNVRLKFHYDNTIQPAKYFIEIESVEAVDLDPYRKLFRRHS